MADRIVVFGATGYTGGLVARALVKRGARPILAARSQTRLEELAAELGGLQTRWQDALDVFLLSHCPAGDQTSLTDLLLALGLRADLYRLRARADPALRLQADPTLRLQREDAAAPAAATRTDATTVMGMTLAHYDRRPVRFDQTTATSTGCGLGTAITRRTLRQFIEGNITVLSAVWL